MQDHRAAKACADKGNDAYMRASAGFMGKTWDTGETAFSAEFWAEVLRVLKPGGHVAAFGASHQRRRFQMLFRISRKFSSPSNACELLIL